MPNRDTVLALDAVHHWFGAHKVIYDVNVSIPRGQIVALVGPSGCGKSTLLRAIVGTHPPRRGRVIMYDGAGPSEGTPVKRPGRDRGIVYQRYSLFPFLTARQNVALGPLLDETSLPFRLFRFPRWRALRRAHLAQATALLEKLGLGQALDLYPGQMSGGMRQRVAVAQALIMQPKILLLDEPFGALDEATREDLQNMLLTLAAENRRARTEGSDPPHTIMIVTHELNEAILVGDRVLGLSQYWDWRGAGLSASPGATIVYDQPAPVVNVDDERDIRAFAKQRRTIREFVFSPEVLQPRNEHRQTERAATTSKA